MSARSFSDVPNRIVHFFLQAAGAEYDRNRDLEPYRKMTPELRSRFGDTCAYCGASDPDVEDHVVPRNRKHVGLHSWGNVVPACRACNRAKRGDIGWEAHPEAIEPDAAIRSERAQRIRDYQAEFKYAPDVEPLRAVLESLYELSDRQTRSLISFAVTASLPYISGLHQLEAKGRAVANLPLAEGDPELDPMT